MTATTILANRQSNIDLVALSVADINGDQSLDFELPVGYGDAILLSWLIRVASIATAQASIENYGPSITVIDRTAGSVSDNADVSDVRWRNIGSSAVSAGEQLISAVLWRYTESVRVRFLEVDTNASPTADLTAYFRVRRLRSP